jgi:hypothetical protein
MMFLKIENRPEESGRFFHSPKPTLVQQGYKEGSEIIISHFAPHPLYTMTAPESYSLHLFTVIFFFLFSFFHFSKPNRFAHNPADKEHNSRKNEKEWPQEPENGNEFSSIKAAHWPA